MIEAKHVKNEQNRAFLSEAETLIEGNATTVPESAK